MELWFLVLLLTGSTHCLGLQRWPGLQAMPRTSLPPQSLRWSGATSASALGAMQQQKRGQQQGQGQQGQQGQQNDYNAKLQRFAASGNVDAAEAVLREMGLREVAPDQSIYELLIDTWLNSDSNSDSTREFKNSSINSTAFTSNRQEQAVT